MGKDKSYPISRNLRDADTVSIYQLKTRSRCLTPKFKVLKVVIFINRRCHKLELKLDVKAAPDKKGREHFAPQIKHVEIPIVFYEML